MKTPVLFVTGTDTGVGKTVLSCWLARRLRDSGSSVAALKPICSGGREDAEALRAALGNSFSLDEINPWHFRAPLAPVLAAHRERRNITFKNVVQFIRHAQERFRLVIVEGAGGLLSPLGEGFDSRDLIIALRAAPLIVCPNRLGAINQARLVLAALPTGLRRRANVFLMSPRQPDIATRSNPDLLKELIAPTPVHLLPWLADPNSDKAFRDRRVRCGLQPFVSEL